MPTPTDDLTAEQQARDMLEQMGVAHAQSWSAGEVVELANLIRDRRRLQAENQALRAEVQRNRDKAMSLGADLLYRDSTIQHLSGEASMLRADVKTLRSEAAKLKG